MPRECPEIIDEHAVAPADLTLDAALSAIFGVMLNVVVIMAAGYWLAQNKGLSKEARAGLSIYIGWAALPTLFFNTLSAEDFLSAEGAVLLAVFLAKCSMVFFSLAAAWATQQFREPAKGAFEFRAGMYALLTTNGDEVGLGVPAMTALFPDKLQLLFVLAGIQKLFFLPIALVLLGAGAAKRDGVSGIDAGTLLKQVLKEKAKDPLVMGIFGGLIYNILGPALHPPCAPDAFLHGLWELTGYAPGLLAGAKLPSYVQKLCEVLGSGFTPTIFLLTGASSVGTWSTLADVGELPTPLVLVLLKSLVLPTLARFILALLGASNTSLDFVFVFCLFSCSGVNAVLVMAKDPNKQQQTVLMATTALAKIIVFPLLLIVPVVFFTHADLTGVVQHIEVGMCVVALLLGGWYFVSSNYWHTPNPHVTWNTYIILEGGYTLAKLCVPWLEHFLGWSADAALISVSALHILNLRVGNHDLGHIDEEDSTKFAKKKAFMEMVLQKGAGSFEHGDEKKPTPPPSPPPSPPPYKQLSEKSDTLLDGAGSDNAEPVEALMPFRHATEEIKKEVKDAILQASGKNGHNPLSPLYLLIVVAAAVVPGAVLTIIAHGNQYGEGSPLSGNPLVYTALALALFALFSVLMQHDGALELKTYNPTYHLFLQRLTILLLMVATQMLLSAALLGGQLLESLREWVTDGVLMTAASKDINTRLSGSASFMLLIIGLLKNGRLVLVFILFGLSRARADMGTLEGWLREKGVLPPRKKEEAPTEDDTAADAMFPPMY